MQSTPRRIVLHVLLFVVVLIVLSAIAIWFRLGPVAHSEAGRSGGVRATHSEAAPAPPEWRR